MIHSKPIGLPLGAFLNYNLDNGDLKRFLDARIAQRRAYQTEAFIIFVLVIVELLALFGVVLYLLS